jgi:ribosomal protein S18 acetylase RimI-like enzyme
MRPVSLHDKTEIAAFLRQKTWMHLYHLGDLDEFFWPYTIWYGAKSEGTLDQLVLLYTGLEDPVMLAITEDAPAMRDLVRSILHLLPPRIYSHLSSGVPEALASAYHIASHGAHDKMLLTDPSQLEKIDVAEAVHLTSADQPELENFYAESYPGNWFDPRMLETGAFYGIRRNGKWASVAGIHVYSPEFRACAIGSVTTHPDYRGQGLAKAACAQLCCSMQGTIDHIGLNVKSDNASAIALYSALGFTKVATYEECTLTLKGLTP